MKMLLDCSCYNADTNLFNAPISSQLRNQLQKPPSTVLLYKESLHNDYLS